MKTLNVWIIVIIAASLLICYSSGGVYNQDRSTSSQEAHSTTGNQKSSKKKLNILLFTLPIAGHYTPILATGEELARRGHNVTLCTGAESNREKIERLAKSVGISYVSAHQRSPWESISPSELMKESKMTKMKAFFDAWQKEINLLLSSWFDAELSTLKQWDVIIADDFLTPALMCIHKRYSIPVFIQASTIQSPFQRSNQWFVPSVMLGNISALNPGLFERIQVLLNWLFFRFIQNSKYLLLTPNNTKYCTDVSTNILIADSTVMVPLFIPTVIGLEYPRTYPPMIHYLGPLLSKSPPPLPKDLQQWLKDRPEHSVVYVSTGSMFEVTYDIGKAIVDGILRTKYSAIWAVRQPEIVDRLEIDAKRIFTMEWAPQLSVLQHKAIGMAILHGGANGVNEALYNGVPPIVLPFAVDQRGIASRVTHQGLGLSLDVGTITAEKITSSIAEINSGDYRRNIEHLQKIFVSAGGVEKAADLVEYYKEVGFDHLIPAYAKYEWSWVQYYNIDVYALLAVILVSVIYCFLKCCQFVCRRTCCKRKEKKD